VLKGGGRGGTHRDERGEGRGGGGINRGRGVGGRSGSGSEPGCPKKIEEKRGEGGGFFTWGQWRRRGFPGTRVVGSL